MTRQQPSPADVAPEGGPVADNGSGPTEATLTPPRAADIVIDVDRISTGDLEDMEEYCQFEVMPRLIEALNKCQTSNPNELLAYLPAKLISAVLGISRRHSDPSYGPDRWRAVTLADIKAPPQPPGGVGGDAEGSPPPPKPASGRTRRARTKVTVRSKTGSPSPNASPKSAPGRTTPKNATPPS